MRMKYPRTPHLPWSRPDEDDIWIDGDAFRPDTQVVVTEKLDGENTSIYNDGSVHARSMDSGDHPSRHIVKAIAGSMVGQMSSDIVLLGENVYAKHSIHYDRLESYFYLFGVRTAQRFLSWPMVEMFAHDLGVPTVPVIYQGEWGNFKHWEQWPRESAVGAEAEGYVVRTVEGFPIDQFKTHVAKYVRTNHVRCSDHWMYQQIVPNGLKIWF